jgi:23S rRNA maturation-related 3'-5' exoribonuclease YhaM
MQDERAPIGHALIRHQEIGTTFEGVYYVESLFVKKTIQDKDYTDLMLRDRSGARPVKYWGVLKDVVKGDYVYISASVGEYMGNASIVAKNVEKSGVPEDMSDYIPIYDDSEGNATRFDSLRSKLAELEVESGDPTPGMMVDEVYKNATFFEKFVVAPGSARPHYGRQGGLLAGTVRTAEACLSMADFYSLDAGEKAIMLASSLLMRIGAIDAYEFRNCMPAVTKRGMMLGMVNLTMTRVWQP